jgi:flavin reductase (DIM6/NTAB) family NADH-FMN oxidoreductase RutF
MPDNPTSPPDALEDPLELSAGAWEPRQIYFLQTALLIPRPVAWVSSLSADGVVNLAPHSYFNGVSDDPPHVMFSIEGETDTWRNVQDRPEFVVNFVTLDLAEPMELTAVAMPAEEDELAWAGLTPEASRCVAPPRVAEAKAVMECRVERTFDVGRRNHVVLGEVLHYKVSPEIWRGGRVDPEIYRPLARLGVRYGELDRVFRMRRPSWDEVRAAGRDGALDLIRRDDE